MLRVRAFAPTVRAEHGPRVEGITPEHVTETVCPRPPQLSESPGHLLLSSPNCSGPVPGASVPELARVIAINEFFRLH